MRLIGSLCKAQITQGRVLLVRQDLGHAARSVACRTRLAGGAGTGWTTLATNPIREPWSLWRDDDAGLQPSGRPEPDTPPLAPWHQPPAAQRQSRTAPPPIRMWSPRCGLLHTATRSGTWSRVSYAGSGCCWSGWHATGDGTGSSLAQNPN